MVKKISTAILQQGAHKDIFQRVTDGDWYQYVHEPKMQAIVQQSAQTVQRINDVAKTDIAQANRLIREFLPNLGQDVELYCPIISIEHPQQLTIGDGSFINARLQVISAGKVTIGKRCFIGPNCQLFTPNHPTDDWQLRAQGWEYDSPITIGDDCWFGGSVIVLPGVTIGHHVVVGAGAVVTHDLPDNVIAAGNPARVIRPVRQPK
ncbi:DapH/DapD/GlmU-related protein [Levilactobacillus zymae]|uniref:DapH/DapD/GlmU-related protein n=1 Tax=Levilactobacillus zymae TaxID=267363 RepID=UPI0028BC32A7|nr:DapH/DapD/GlmU-related protein [Levilactobacillus zymae]MDT6981156.1 DapH/DapD/GlmU-related protein [Levilactobacillus zymae]